MGSVVRGSIRSYYGQGMFKNIVSIVRVEIVFIYSIMDVDTRTLKTKMKQRRGKIDEKSYNKPCEIKKTY